MNSSGTLSLTNQFFSLDVPAGYKIAEQEADAGTTASDAFVKMLKFYVRLNDEQFPDEISNHLHSRWYEEGP